MDLFFESHQEGPPPMTTTTPPAEFALAMRGYDRVQVDEYLAAQEGWLAEAEARIAEAERIASLAVLETEQLRQRLTQVEDREMSEPPRSIEALGERVGRILQLAWDSAEELRAEAGEAATEREEQASRFQRQAERRAEEIEREAASTLEEASRQAEAHLEEVRRQAERTGGEIVEEARAEAERVVDEAMGRRNELEGEIDALNQRGETAVIELDRVRNTLEQALADAPIVLPGNGNGHFDASSEHEGEPARPRVI